jgi:hypothetical protein
MRSVGKWKKAPPYVGQWAMCRQPGFQSRLDLEAWNPVVTIHLHGMEGVLSWLLRSACLCLSALLPLSPHAYKYFTCWTISPAHLQPLNSTIGWNPVFNTPALGGHWRSERQLSFIFNFLLLLFFFYSPVIAPLPVPPPTVPHPIPPLTHVSKKMSRSSSPKPQPDLPTPWVLKHWEQTRQSSAVYVLGTSDQLVHAACLVPQWLRDLRGPG